MAKQKNEVALPSRPVVQQRWKQGSTPAHEIAIFDRPETYKVSETIKTDLQNAVHEQFPFGVPNDIAHLGLSRIAMRLSEMGEEFEMPIAPNYKGQVMTTVGDKPIIQPEAYGIRTSDYQNLMASGHFGNVLNHWNPTTDGNLDDFSGGQTRIQADYINFAEARSNKVRRLGRLADEIRDELSSNGNLSEEEFAQLQKDYDKVRAEANKAASAKFDPRMGITPQAQRVYFDDSNSRWEVQNGDNRQLYPGDVMNSIAQLMSHSSNNGAMLIAGHRKTAPGMDELLTLVDQSDGRPSNNQVKQQGLQAVAKSLVPTRLLNLLGFGSRARNVMHNEKFSASAQAADSGPQVRKREAKYEVQAGDKPVEVGAWRARNANMQVDDSKTEFHRKTTFQGTAKSELAAQWQIDVGTGEIRPLDPDVPNSPVAERLQTLYVTEASKSQVTIGAYRTTDASVRTYNQRIQTGAGGSVKNTKAQLELRGGAEYTKVGTVDESRESWGVTRVTEVGRNVNATTGFTRKFAKFFQRKAPGNFDANVRDYAQLVEIEQGSRLQWNKDVNIGVNANTGRANVNLPWIGLTKLSSGASVNGHFVDQYDTGHDVLSATSIVYQGGTQGIQFQSPEGIPAQAYVAKTAPSSLGTDYRGNMLLQHAIAVQNPTTEAVNAPHVDRYDWTVGVHKEDHLVKMGEDYHGNPIVLSDSVETQSTRYADNFGGWLVKKLSKNN